MDYATLKTNIEDWTHRAGLTAKVDTFIDLFEARVNRVIRVPEMEKRATSTPTGEYVALPTDFLELRNIQINTSPPTLLEYASPQKIDALGTLTGTPRYYTLVGNEFQIAPTASGKVVEISYFGSIPALSDTNTSNWLLAAHPDYYLAGCLFEASVYVSADAGLYSQIVVDKENTINRSGRKKQYGTGPLVVSAV